MPSNSHDVERSTIHAGLLRTVERFAAAAGTLMLLAFGCAMLQAHVAQRAASLAYPARQPLAQQPQLQTAAATRVYGTIQIPSLSVSAPITDGIGRLDLIRGVGHIPGTAMAGGLGTMALAGHRDTFFRALRNVTPGTQILVRSSEGQFRYDVDSLTVVKPEQVEVLDIVDVPQLVLVTCYPFDFIGAAPQRFIVRAHLVSAEATALSN